MKIISKVDILSRNFDHKTECMLNKEVFTKLVPQPVKVTLASWLLSQTQNCNHNHNSYLAWQILKTKHLMLLGLFHGATRYPMFEIEPKDQKYLKLERDQTISCIVIVPMKQT